MTNKEKAAEIAHDLITHQVQDDWWYPRAQEHYEEALEKMGDWKDEETKSILRDRYNIWKVFLLNGHDSMKIKISGLQEIYEELFGEPLND